MRIGAYPELEAHAAEHRSLLGRIASYRERFDCGEADVLAELDRIRVAPDATNEEVEAAARASAKVIEATAGQTVVKAIIVLGKLVNIVAKPA